jgi:hypothetical protein
MTFKFARRRRASLAAVVIAMVAGTAQAVEAPTWRFEKGLKSRFRMTQSMQMTMTMPGGAQSSSTVTNVIDMSWVVDEVKDDGSAVITQKMDRMRMTVAAPDAEEVQFDSQSQEEPQGFAAMIAPMIRELTKASFVVTMTPLGEIKDVEIPEEAVKAIAAAPGAQLMGDMATADGLKNMIMRSAFAMPEELEPGNEWANTVEMAVPMLGKQIIKTTYRYVGPQEREGVHFEAVEPKLELSYEGGSVTVNVTNQESSGEVLFNRDAGRLESTRLVHKMSLSIAAAGSTMDQSLEQNVEMRWVPEGEENQFQNNE